MRLACPHVRLLSNFINHSGTTFGAGGSIFTLIDVII